jgi:Kef-type K+ transport system membrane component KefB
MSALLLPAQARDAGAQSPVGAVAEEIVLSLLVQIIAILAVTRAVVWIARRLGQTDVSGEILAGLLLGPSLLQSSLFGPDVQKLMHDLFSPSTSVVFTGLAQIGLILLMFQIGLEFEFLAHLGDARRPVVAISVAGFVLPFAIGYLAAPWFHARLGAPEVPLFGFRLFFAVALSITAIPVLGRIFMEMGLSHTRTAALTIAAAAIQDVTGWLVLGAIALLVQGQLAWGWALPRVAALAAYLGVVLLLLRPVLKRAVARHLDLHGGLRLSAVPWLLLLLFVSAAITSRIGVFAIIGGFVIGVALHDDRRFVEEWRRRVGPLVQSLFLPLFFAYTGIRTDVGTIHGAAGLGMLLLLLAIAFASKFGASYVAARLVGEDNRSALSIGVCMNTRALMELIVLNIGKDLGLLPTNIFSMLVIMAVASTFITTPLIRRLMKDEMGSGPGLGEPVAPAAAR